MATILQASDESIQRAAEVLRGDGVVAFPTETVYGLGGRTFSRRAVQEIHALKGRPANNPLIAHVLDEESATRVAAEWNDNARKLTAAFWPGPLTLVVPRRATVPREATGGLDTVAIRSPRHPVARKLLELLNGDPISAPSANLSGRTSATSAEHVRGDFAHVRELLVLDGGPCSVGIESTVVDLTATPVRVLRPGSVTAQDLERVLGAAVDSARATKQGASPGTAGVHYAPRTPALMVMRADLETFLATHPERCAVLMSAPAHEVPLEVRSRHEIIPMPAGTEEYSACLYDRLRLADNLRCAQIVIEHPSTDSDAKWDAVLDRLTRATAAGRPTA